MNGTRKVSIQIQIQIQFQIRNQIKSNQISSFDLSEAKLFGVVPDALDIVLKLLLKLGLKMQYFVVEGMYVPVCTDGWI